MRRKTFRQKLHIVEATSLSSMAATRVDSTAKPEPDVHHHDVPHDVHQQDVREAEKLGVEVDEVVVTRISEEDMMRTSRECLDFHSRTGFYIVLITLCMGFNMAGYVQDRLHLLTLVGKGEANT